EERLHLLTERLVLAACQHQLAAVPQGIAGEGDLQCPPGALVGHLQRLGQPAAVIAEMARQEYDNALHRSGSWPDAGYFPRSADQLLHGQGVEIGRDAHDSGSLVGCFSPCEMDYPIAPSRKQGW